MDDALVLVEKACESSYFDACLNPCFNGWCTRTFENFVKQTVVLLVLILVLMDDALVPINVGSKVLYRIVLILVLMDDALVQ